MKGFIIFLFLFSVCNFSYGQADKKGIISLQGKCILNPDTIDGRNVYSSIDKMPEFPGGEQKLMQYIQKNLKHPEIQGGYQNTIYVTFIIDTTGHVRNSCIVNPFYKDDLTYMEAEALRVVNRMPAWTPGELDNIKVPVRFNLPFRFN